MPKLAKVLGIGVMPLFYKSSASIASTCWIPTNVSQKRVLVHKLYHVCIFFNPNWCGEAYYEVLTDIFFFKSRQLGFTDKISMGALVRCLLTGIGCGALRDHSKEVEI